MVDPVLVQAVLDEQWGASADGDVYSQSSGKTILVGANPSGGRDEERARQAALGHRLLALMAKDYDANGECVVCTTIGDNDDCATCAILAELRGGK